MSTVLTEGSEGLSLKVPTKCKVSFCMYGCILSTKSPIYSKVFIIIIIKVSITVIYPN